MNRPISEIRFFPVPEDRSRRRLTTAHIRHFNQQGYLSDLESFTAEEALRNRQDFDRLLAQTVALGMDSYSMKNYERT